MLYMPIYGQLIVPIHQAGAQCTMVSFVMDIDRYCTLAGVGKQTETQSQSCEGTFYCRFVELLNVDSPFKLLRH